jgi:hypothetical protein
MFEKYCETKLYFADLCGWISVLINLLQFCLNGQYMYVCFPCLFSELCTLTPNWSIFFGVEVRFISVI